MARTSEYKPEYCEIAVKVLASGESKAAVAAEIGTSKQTLYKWMSIFPDFKDAIECGLALAQRDWELLGRDGITGRYEKFSAAGWIFTMKNRFRDDYAEDKKEEKSESTSLLEKLITGEIKVSHE